MLTNDSCERENRWLNESDYAIDASLIPRGGHRRRKSMEPKLLSNLNGTLSVSATTRQVPPQTDSQRRVTIAVPKATSEDGCSSPATPDRVPPAAAHDNDDQDELSMPNTPASDIGFDLPATPARPGLLTGGANSPTTPYFLHPTELVQQTCPPKQTQQALFPLSGRINDQPDGSVRQRLMAARRKSLQFAPKVKSPLARNF